MAGDEAVRDYVTLVRGITYKGELVGKPGPALLGLGSIHPGGGFREGDYKTYGGDCPPKLMLTPGDLFVSLKGATKDGKMIGSVARVPASVPSGRLTQDTVKLEFRSDERAQASSYIYWMLRTPQYRAYCEGRSMGSAVVALSRDDFLAFPVPIVSGTRQAIVELLERIEDKIELNRRMNAKLEEMARELFQSWFVDFDPVRAKLDGRQPAGLDPATAALFPDSFQDSTLGTIPHGWRAVHLESIASVGSGKRPEGRSDVLSPECNIPLYGGGGRIGYVTSALYDQPILLTGRVGTLGLIFRTAEPSWPSDNTLIVEPQPGLLDFTYFLLKGFDLLTLNRGSTQPLLTQADLKRQALVLPAKDVVKVFTDVSEPIFRKISSNERESCTLATLRNSLLPKLLSGELHINE
jgi:type I restriction enzyme S subunit